MKVKKLMMTVAFSVLSVAPVAAFSAERVSLLANLREALGLPKEGLIRSWLSELELPTIGGQKESSGRNYNINFSSGGGRATATVEDTESWEKLGRDIEKGINQVF